MNSAVPNSQANKPSNNYGSLVDLSNLGGNKTTNNNQGFGQFQAPNSQKKDAFDGLMKW